MPFLNILCPICTEAFQNSDDVYSTSCGHLFHFRCLNEWQSRGTSCPQCRQHNPKTHKIYLSFDETETVDIEELEEIRLKLKTSNDRITEVLSQKNEAESNFMELQKQFTDTTEQLQDRLQELTIENKSIAKELNLKIIENETLKASFEVGQSSSPSDGALSQKIQILEQKIKYITKELEKEIVISTQLSIDKMKLESFIKYSNNTEKIEKLCDKENGKKPYLKKNHENNALPKVLEKQKVLSAIFIKNLPPNQVTYPLEMIIVNLAAKMNLTISPDDLIKVNFVKNDNDKYTKARLVAQFKDSELRSKFLYMKHFLKYNKETEFIIIGDHTDNKFLSLYDKKKIRHNRYSHIGLSNVSESSPIFRSSFNPHANNNLSTVSSSTNNPILSNTSEFAVFGSKTTSNVFGSFGGVDGGVKTKQSALVKPNDTKPKLPIFGYFAPSNTSQSSHSNSSDFVFDSNTAEDKATIVTTTISVTSTSTTWPKNSSVFGLTAAAALANTSENKEVAKSSPFGTFGSCSTQSTNQKQSASIFGLTAPNIAPLAAPAAKIIFFGETLRGKAATPTPAFASSSFGGAASSRSANPTFGSTAASGTTYGSTTFGSFGGSSKNITKNTITDVKKPETAFSFSAASTTKPIFNFGGTSTNQQPTEGTPNAPFQFNAGDAPVLSNIFAPPPEASDAQKVQLAKRKIRAASCRTTLGLTSNSSTNLFGTNAAAPATKSIFGQTLGGNAATPTPAFGSSSFGGAASSTSATPTFGRTAASGTRQFSWLRSTTGGTKTETAFSFDAASTNKSTKGGFNFGSSASMTKPAFNFGGTSITQQPPGDTPKSIFKFNAGAAPVISNIFAPLPEAHEAQTAKQDKGKIRGPLRRVSKQ